MELNSVLNIIKEKLINNYFIYEKSFNEYDGSIIFLFRNNYKKFFGEISHGKNFTFSNPLKEIIKINLNSEYLYMGIFDTTTENTKKITSLFSYATPKRINKKSSIGFGDRIGIATGIHAEIVKGYNVFPLFTQQSAREISKTSRSCEEVVKNTVLGIFQNGYKSSWGADADHIRDTKWLEIMLNNSFLPYSMFTIDTYDYVNEDLNSPFTDPGDNNNFKNRLKKAQRLIGTSINYFGYNFTYDENNIYSIVKRYYKSLDFLSKCFNIIKNKLTEFDFEPTFDERDAVDTKPEDHFYLTSELINDGIHFTSFAPKFPGLFHKGIDYEGDIENFIYYLKIHKKITDSFGFYKLSLHSADDKFKILKVFNYVVCNNFHIKTSGTTWMEGLRTIAQANPDLFKSILKLSLIKSDENCQSYYIKLDINKINDLIKTKNLVELIDIKDTRQLLHVSYGDILQKYKGECVETLLSNEVKYAENVKNNYKTHLESIFS